MNRKTILAISAVAALFCAAHANAGTMNYQAGDVLLGFHAIDGSTGAGQSFVIDLGSITQFENKSASFTWDLSGALNTLFGTNGDWYNNSGLYWGASMANGTALGSDPKNTLAFTAVNTNDPWEAASNFTQSSIVGKVSNIQTAFKLGDTTSGQTVLGSNSVSQASSMTNDWAEWQPDYTATFTSFQNALGGTIEGQTGDALNFYEMLTSNAGNPGALLGSFSMDSNGTLSFTGAEAVPEPSTYAMLGFGALGLFGAMRRRLCRKAA